MTRRATHWLVALAACVAMIALNAFTGEFPHEAVRVVDVGRPGRLYDSTVTVNSWRIGQVLYNDDLFVGRSAVIFLAVNVTVATDGTERSTSWEVGGTNGSRTFAPRDRVSVPQPGFRITQDVVFELSAHDLPGFTATFLDRPPIYAFDPQVDVPLGISEATANETFEASQYDTVKAVTGRPEVIR